MSVVLLIGVLKEASGNNSTLNRIRKYFKNCFLEDCSSFKDENDLESFIHHHHISCIFALHAFHSGKLFKKGCPIPFSIILGGTDINSFSHHHHCNNVMRDALNNSTSIIAFSEWMKLECIHIWPELKTKKFFEICQAVTRESEDIPATMQPSHLTTHKATILTNHSDNKPTLPTHKNHFKHETICTNQLQAYISTDLNQALPTHLTTHLPTHLQTTLLNTFSTHLVFTMLTGLRLEKDPLYLLDAFQRWSEMSGLDVLLLVIGAQTNKEYSKLFLERIKKYSSVKYLGSMPKWQVDQVLRRTFAVVNSSQSEGMCQSILEAMQHGVPVIARDIAANRDLITHLSNGLLYHTPQEFIEEAERLVGEGRLREGLVQGGRLSIHHRHSQSAERDRYLRVVRYMEKPLEVYGGPLVA